MELTVVESDADYEAWRQVRIAVLPHERCATLEKLRAAASPTRLLLVARVDGTVVGSGMADRAESAGRSSVAPRVVPAYRRRGYGTALLAALSDHCRAIGFPVAQSFVDDEGSLAFAERAGFHEVDRQVEQVRTIGEEPEPPPLGDDLEVVTLAERPELWADCYATFGREVMADFAVIRPLDISATSWESDWTADPMFLALHDGAVVGCAGLILDTDRPERAEHALTAVARAWRGRGVAVHLKRRTLHWAATHGLREVYTWTQDRNAAMRALNRRLGYADGQVSVTVSRDLSQ